MKKSILLSTILLACGLTANAQKTEEYEYVFQPHWELGAQIGGQYTLGETSFSDLLSPNAQLSAEYKFNKLFGLRGGFNFWQSKGGLKGNVGTQSFERNWKYNYVAFNLDATLDLSNLIAGYNPNRVVSVGAFAGIGLNVGFNNDEANDVSKELHSTYPTWVGSDGQNLGNLWDGTKVRLQGRAGAYVDFRVSEKLKLGLEVNANLINDKYNSKKASNADWYFNGLVGVKYTLGNAYTKKAKQCCTSAPEVKEKVVEKIVEKKVEVEKVQPIRRDIFFTIRGSEISLSEMQKVREIAEYMKKYPESKVVVTGYADKGTGNSAINSKYAEQRAKKVADTLEKNYGIAASRITYTSKGDTEQPYAEQVLNRVSICIAE